MRKFAAVQHTPGRLMMAVNTRKMHPRRVDGVVFDMDGVIFDSENLNLCCWHEIAARYGIRDIDTPCRAVIGRNSAEGRRIFKEFYGPDFPYEERRDEVLTMFREKTENGELAVKKGARELLSFLRGMGKKIALASSTDRDRVLWQLDHAGLLGYFDTVIGGDMVKKSKPDPDIYLTACREVGFLPEHAYAVEDSYNGVRSAAASGAHTIMVPDLLPPDSEMAGLAEVIVDDLFEVRDYLRRIFAESCPE
ncbi:HAD family hydrolase [Clostridium vitabionis]|uniref:HAD family hydrolase n=1 Tax=Clostridium vitabionis TaxID=2784388 RepID=UPI002E2D3769|nr:HAD family phosphatase [Clostridium vitabionis]